MTPSRLTPLLTLAIAVLHGGGCAAQPPATADLLTHAEATHFAETSSLDHVLDLAERLAARSPRVELRELGRTAEGRPIPLLIIADPPVRDAQDARDTGRLVALAIGTIHGGEVCGKEALLMLARELALADHHPLLDQLVLAIVPVYNPDGSERISTRNRPGQNGPQGGVGIRTNAAGLDLNRDYVKLEAPESRALAAFIRAWDPHLIIDTHTTNGSRHRYALTYQGPKHPAGDLDLLQYVRDEMLPRIAETVRRDDGFETQVYGNFDAARTRWETYPAMPRYGTPYRGLRNRVAILTEAYAYDPFERRVQATLAFVRAALADAAAHADTIRRLCADADRRSSDAGRHPRPDDLVPIRTIARPFDEPLTILAYATREHEGRLVDTDEPADYRVALVNDFVASLAVPRPFAYLIPPDRPAVRDTLLRHGIDIHELREDLELEVTEYLLTSVARSDEPFQGHHLARVEASAHSTRRRIPAGTLVARTGQPLGALLVNLLEPQAEDGLVAWNFFDDALLPGQPFEVLRLEQPLPLITRQLPPVEEDRQPPRPLTFELLYESDDPPRFDGPPVRGLDWLPDGLHYLQNRNGRLYRVHAPTGRFQPLFDPDLLADALARHPAFDPDQARRIAHATRFTFNHDHSAILIDHDNDLYYARLDGSSVRRLTATPDDEELPTFSPDGQFVAFVQHNDLWVVDIATATSRRLTTTGSDHIRNGKATWVYFEELFNRSWRTYWWSPDSRRLAFLETDVAGVPPFTIVDNLAEPQRVETEHFPKPGQTNPRVRLGFVTVSGGTPRFADLSAYDATATLITGVGWWPDASRAWLFLQDRAQTYLDLSTVPPSGGTPLRLLRQRTEAWVDTPLGPFVLHDGSFLLTGEADGWRHLSRFAPDGTPIQQLTTGPWEVRALEHIDHDNQWVYFSATADSHLEHHLYRIRFDGTDLTRLTTDVGHHSVSVSPNGSMFLDTWSSLHTTPRVALFDTRGALLRTIDTNPVPQLDQFQFGQLELFDIPSRRGEPLPAIILTPPQFDPSRTYPVWFTTYAGPHAPTIRNTWAGGRADDHLLATLGFIVFRADPYSATGRGARSAWTAYRRLGQPELEDIEDAIDWIASQPFVDPHRIGMVGHSYGGFITAYAMTHSDRFAAGVAGAPVTDWRDYDSIYTERYMDTPQNNPDGYAHSSVVEAATHLAGRLLLLHGALDDNVHLQHSLRLARALDEADRHVELFIYPAHRHGLGHVAARRRILRFLTDQLRPDADSTSAEPALQPASRPRPTPPQP